MTIGEHLEELRRRLILSLIGFGIVFGVCLLFGQQVMAAFCRPLISVLQQYEVNPQIYFTQVSDPFMVFIKVSLVSACAIAAPWMVYQLWLFVAAGLYPHERKIVTRLRAAEPDAAGQRHDLRLFPRAALDDCNSFSPSRSAFRCRRSLRPYTCHRPSRRLLRLCMEIRTSPRKASSGSTRSMDGSSSTTRAKCG